MQHER
ncbi:Protein of unknown function [Bacillus wiedmannii]